MKHRMIGAPRVGVPLIGRPRVGVPAGGTFSGRAIVVPDAAATTAFLARTTGLNATHTNAYRSLINGLVTAGVFSKLDALYMLATQDGATSLLNLVSASFPLTTTGTITFTADQGYAGNGVDGRLNTGFIPSTAGGNYTLNSAHHSAYVRTSRAAGGASSTLGTSTATGSAYSYMETYNTGNARVTMNDGTFSGVANGNAQGMYVVSRTSNLAIAMRRNQGALFSSGAVASVALPDQQYLICCNNDTGGSPLNFVTDQIAAVSLGGGLTLAESDTLSARINAFMTTLGTNVY